MDMDEVAKAITFHETTVIDDQNSNDHPNQSRNKAVSL